MHAATRKAAPFYRLMQRDSEGRAFYLTGLGEFRSGLEAVDAWRAQPRNGVAYVVELRDVGYGITSQVVATAGA